jgi:hypothetical protein
MTHAVDLVLFSKRILLVKGHAIVRLSGKAWVLGKDVFDTSICVDVGKNFALRERFWL